MDLAEKGILGTIVGAVLLTVAMFVGWGINVGKLVQCDFKAPYKAEVVRSVGVVIPMVGGIAGFMEIGDE